MSCGGMHTRTYQWVQVIKANFIPSTCEPCCRSGYTRPEKCLAEGRPAAARGSYLEAVAVAVGGYKL